MEESTLNSSEPIISFTRQQLHLLSQKPSSFERNFEAIGYITACLRHAGIHPIVVGGQAVELYTFSHYATVDVDLVLNGYEMAGNIFESIGFIPKGAGQRHWYHAELDLPLEIPDSVLFGSMDKVNEISIHDVSVFVIGIEDLILDRLRAGVHWNSNSDHELAEILLDAYNGKLDIDYMDQQASSIENQVWDAWSQLKGKYDIK